MTDLHEALSQADTLGGFDLDRILTAWTGHDWEWWTAMGEDFVEPETGDSREEIVELVSNELKRRRR